MSAPEPERPVPREELEVAVEARRELSVEHEPELIEAFLGRVGDAIDARVDQRVAERDDDGGGFDPGAIGVALGSVGLGIPVTAVAGDVAGIAGVIIAWIGIVLVNVAYSRSTQ